MYYTDSLTLSMIRVCRTNTILISVPGLWPWIQDFLHHPVQFHR
jgi:hypothetical protein